MAAARLCERLGHCVEEARPEIDAKAHGTATFTVVCANIRATLETRAAALGRELIVSDVERLTWARATDGHRAHASDYARSMAVIHRVGRQIARFFTRYDMLLTPTICQPPRPLGILDLMTENEEAYTQAVLECIAFTSVFNSAGSPAMSVPRSRRRSPGSIAGQPEPRGGVHGRAGDPRAPSRGRVWPALPPCLRPQHGRFWPHRAPGEPAPGRSGFGPDLVPAGRRASAAGRGGVTQNALVGCAQSSQSNPRRRAQGLERLRDLLRASRVLQWRRGHGPRAGPGSADPPERRRG